MRLFIALCFSDPVLDAICNVRDALRRGLDKASYTPRDNMHMTLGFLGECDGAGMENACRAMDALDFEPFPILLDHVGSFHRSDGDIIWLGAKRSEPLLALQRDLEANLLERGLIQDGGKFKPHVTLARRAFPAFHGVLRSDTIGQDVSSISLMLSKRVDGHMEYTPIHVKCSNRRSMDGENH